MSVKKDLDVITIGRASVDLYGAVGSGPKRVRDGRA